VTKKQGDSTLSCGYDRVMAKNKRGVSIIKGAEIKGESLKQRREVDKKIGEKEPNETFLGPLVAR